MKVGIVGGGISGLALQHFLARSPVDSVVFEATPKPGGVMKSVRVDGRVLDLGPQRTRLTPPVESLVRSLGLRGDVLEAENRPLYVYRDGALRRVPFGLRDAATTDLLSLRGKLRVLLEPLTGPPQADETVQCFLERTLGREAAAYVGGPLYGGIYASDPGEMPMEYSLGRALEKHGVSRSLLAAMARAKLDRSDPPPKVSFDGGMQPLPRTLYERHRDDVRLDTPVESIDASGDRFDLRTRNGVTTVDSVVLTTPADVTASLLEPVTPEIAAALRRLNYNPLAIVHLESDVDLGAAGYKVQRDEPFRTLGVTSQADLFDREGLYACFLGGSKTPSVVDWSDGDIRRTAVREFRELTGGDARVLNVHRLSRGMPAYDTSWSALDRLDLPDGVHLCANYRSRAGVPGRVVEARTLADRLVRDGAEMPTSATLA